MKYSSEELHNLETRQMKQPAFKAGFNAAIPIILKAVEQRDNLRIDDYGDIYNQQLIKQSKFYKVKLGL